MTYLDKTVREVLADFDKLLELETPRQLMYKCHSISQCDIYAYKNGKKKHINRKKDKSIKSVLL